MLFNPALEVPDNARLQQLKERERALHANPFNAATFNMEKKKEKERKKAEKLEPNWKPAMATFKATHQSSAAAMALLGGKPKAAATADATQTDAAPAEAASTGAVPSDAVAPPDDLPQHVQESVPEEEVATVPVAPVSDTPVSDPATDPVLQRRLQPWRLLSARVPSKIGRRQGPSRPTKACKKVHKK